MNYKVPLRDMAFVANEVLDMPGHYAQFERGKAVDQDTLDAIFSEAAKFCENELEPLNKIGDEVG